MKTEEAFQKELRGLIESGKRDEAIEFISSRYKIEKDKAEEYYNKLKRSIDAEYKIFKPKVAGYFAKGCGCFSIFFGLVFAITLYNTIDFFSHSNNVEGKVIGTYVYEEVNSDGVIVTYFEPIITYEVAGTSYTDTLRHNYQEKRYEEGENIRLSVDAKDPRIVENETFWDSLLNSSFLLIFSIIAFVGYRVLRNFKIKYKPPKIPEPQNSEDISESDDKAEPSFTFRKVESDGEEKHAKENTRQYFKKYMVGIVGGVFVLLGLGMVGIIIYDQFRGSRLEASGQKIIGVVSNVDYSRGTRRSSSSTYFVDILYDYEGVQYTHELTTGFKSYEEGDKVEMLVDPGNPEDAAVNTREDLYGKMGFFWPLFLTGAGVFTLYAVFRGRS